VLVGGRGVEYSRGRECWSTRGWERGVWGLVREEVGRGVEKRGIFGVCGWYGMGGFEVFWWV